MATDSMHGSRVLVTGGAGFIGTALCKQLLRHGAEVRVLDSFDRPSSAFARVRPDVQVVTADVRDADTVTNAATGCDIVAHLASVAGVQTVRDNPVLTMEVALFGTHNVLSAAVRRGCRRVVDFSTSEVFGASAFKAAENNVTSIGAVGEPRWTYAVSKLASEHLTHAFGREHGLETVSVRPFNVYGPGQEGPGAIRAFVLASLRREPLLVYGDGSAIRAWTYVTDLVDGVMACCARPGVAGEAFNLGNPRAAISTFALAEFVRDLAGTKSPIQFAAATFEDVTLRVPHVEKARTLLGFEPRVDLQEGLVRTLDWYRSALLADPCT